MKPLKEENTDKFEKYTGKTDDKLLSYLKRNFRTYDLGFTVTEIPIKLIVIDDKSYRIQGNKKSLVNRIFNEINEVWSGLTDDVKRRTIKKFLDGIK